MSNREMLSKACTLVLVGCSLWAQSNTAESEKDSIERVKALLVASLDGNLPKVTLEFFLKYEGEGAAIQWRVSDCAPLKVGAVQRESGTCVRADVELKDNRSASVVVSIGKTRGHPDGAPSIYRVAVTDANGRTNVLDHLGDLPVELHRPLPKSPRDLPLPVGAV